VKRIMRGLPKPLNWAVAIMLIFAAMVIVPIFATFL
jgi:hypothetical protein